MYYKRLKEAIAEFSSAANITDLTVYLYETNKKNILYKIINGEHIDINMSPIEKSVPLLENHQIPSDSDLEAEFNKSIPISAPAIANSPTNYIYDIREIINMSAPVAIPYGAYIVFNIYSKSVERIFKVKLIYIPDHVSVAELYRKLLRFETNLKEIYLDICLERVRLTQYIEGCYDKLQSKLYINDYLIEILQSTYLTAADTPDINAVLDDAAYNRGEINKLMYILGDIVKMTKYPYIFLNHAKNLNILRIRDSVINLLIDNIRSIVPDFNSDMIIFKTDRESAAYNTCEYLIDMCNMHRSLYYLLYTYQIVYHKNCLKMTVNTIDIYLHDDTKIDIVIHFKDVTYDGYTCSVTDFCRFVESIRNSAAEPEILYTFVEYLTGTITTNMNSVAISYPVINLQNVSKPASQLKTVSEYFKLKYNNAPPIDSTRKRACILLVGFNKAIDDIFNDRLNSENFSCQYIQITNTKDYWRAVNTIKRQFRKYQKRAVKRAKDAADDANSAADSDDSFIKKYSTNTSDAVNRFIGRLSDKFSRRSPSKLRKSHKTTNLASSKSENDKSADDIADQFSAFSLKPPISGDLPPPLNSPKRDTNSLLLSEASASATQAKSVKQAKQSKLNKSSNSVHSSPVSTGSRRDSTAYSSSSITYDDIISDNTDYISTSDERADDAGATSASNSKTSATPTSIAATIFRRNKPRTNSRSAFTANARRNRGMSKKYNTSLVSYIRRLKIKCFMIIFIGDLHDVDKSQIIAELITSASSHMSGPIGISHSVVKFMYVDTRSNLEAIRSRDIKLPHQTVAPTFDIINEFSNIRQHLLLEYNKVSKPADGERILIIHQNSITSTYLYLLLMNKGFGDVTVFDHNLRTNEDVFVSTVCSYNVFYVDYYIDYFYHVLETLNSRETYKIIVIANSISYDKKIELYNSGVNRVLREPIKYEDILPIASNAL